MKTKQQIIDIIGNSNVPYVDSFTLNNVNYGRSLFNLDWLKFLIDTPKTIFDIGCYDGGDSIRFKQAFPFSEVYSFEASPTRINILKKYSSEYGFNVVEQAVCDYDGTINFYESLIDKTRVDAQGSIFKHTDFYKNKYPRVFQNEEFIKVPCTTVESFCFQNNINEIDLAHIDVEGAELNVIKGFGKFLPKMVFIETLGDEMFHGGTKKEDIHDLLISYGYFLAKDLSTDRLYILKKMISND